MQEGIETMHEKTRSGEIEDRREDEILMSTDTDTSLVNLFLEAGCCMNDLG